MTQVLLVVYFKDFTSLFQDQFLLNACQDNNMSVKLEGFLDSITGYLMYNVFPHLESLHGKHFLVVYFCVPFLQRC